jgi:hypothetical protein
MSDTGKLQDDGDPGLGELYRRTRIEQPPAALDKRILDSARRQTAGRRQRLLIPLASAALVLIGLSLTLRVLELDKPLEKALTPSSAVPLEPEADEAAAPPAGRNVKRQTLHEQIPVIEAGHIEDSDRQAPMPSIPAPKKETAPSFIPSQGFAPRDSRPETSRRAMRTPAPMHTMQAKPTVADRLEDQLQVIRSLLAQGNEDEAREALDELLRSQPQLQIPEDLKFLLTSP